MLIKHKTKEFIRKIGTPLDFLSVKQYYERAGWKIITFNKSSQIISDLGLQSRAEKEKGFIYTNGAFKYIFLNSALSEHEKRNVIFHEAGHIELKSICSDLNNDASERLANEFAIILINHCDKLQYSNFYDKKRISVIIYVIISFLMILEIGLYKKHYTSNEYVYVTRSGSKYHQKNCYYIRKSNDIIKIEKEMAENNYLPCSVCFKN